jgi:glutamyl/glutaminyl-tRNA synthetase
VIGRFAPSTTGEAHPGTLLSALLVWLDARSRGGRALLRLEDLDPDRAKPSYARQLVEALAWLELDWDGVVAQSDRGEAYAAALDQLAAQGRLYPCACSRAQRTLACACRGRALADWRASAEPLRVQLDDVRVELVDDLGVELSQTPAEELGDPIVRRRDGAIAYQLAVVVDDADAGITDIVRGRDIASSTATQILLQRLLGLPTPRYKHHFLLLEGADKLSKLHGSIPFSRVRERHTAGELIEILAAAAGQEPRAHAGELIASFDWARVPRGDRLARFTDRLEID